MPLTHFPHGIAFKDTDEAAVPTLTPDTTAGGRGRLAGRAYTRGEGPPQRLTPVQCFFHLVTDSDGNADDGIHFVFRGAAVAGGAGTFAVNLSGTDGASVYMISKLTDNITLSSITNAQSTSGFNQVLILAIQGASPYYDISWPANVFGEDGGSVPALPQTEGAIYPFWLMNVDGSSGDTWYAIPLGWTPGGASSVITTDAGDADLDYVQTTHGGRFTIYATDQTTTRVWTFPIAEGDSTSGGFVYNNSPSEDVTLRVEDIASPLTYASTTLPAGYGAWLIKREDDQWLVSTTSTVLGTLAAQNSVQASDVSFSAQWRLVARTSAGAGVGDEFELSSLTAESAPASGDLFWMQRASDGAWRGVAFSDLTGSVPTPDIVTATPTTGVYSLLDADRASNNKVVIADEAVDVELAADAGVGSIWEGWALTASTVTISVAGDAGSINGASGATKTLAGNGSYWRAVVVSNPGSAPVVQLEGETTENRTLGGNLDGDGNTLSNIVCDTDVDLAGPLISTDANNTLTGSPKIWVGLTANLPGSPDADTLYFTTD